MLKDYTYFPSSVPCVGFDIRFAAKYGYEEAIVFNDLYLLTQIIYRQHQYKAKHWLDAGGCMEEDGVVWFCLAEEYLYGRIAPFFDGYRIRAVLLRLEQEGLLTIRPSATDGCYWVAIGEERGHPDE